MRGEKQNEQTTRGGGYIYVDLSGEGSNPGSLGAQICEGNYLQVIRKLASDYKRAIDEIAESHSEEEVEVDGTMCFTVTSGCEFCEQWRMLNEQQ